MPELPNYSEKARTHVPYTPARLTEGKEWYVSFYAMDPLKGAMRRKKIKVNRIEDLKERRAYARKMVTNLNRDLANGWNPWVANIAPKGLHRLRDAIKTFLDRKLLEIEHDSKRTYISQVKSLDQWLVATGRKDIQALAFARKDASAYLDYLLEERRVGARTYNNYRTWCKILFNWLEQREYTRGNPFNHLPKLREKEKTRQVIPEDMRRRIREHLEQRDRQFLLSVFLMFYTQVRPAEQCKLRAKDIDLQRQIIVLHGGNTKNHKSRFPTIPNVFHEFLLTLPWDRIRPDDYIIGRGWVPGPVKLDPREISRRWAQLREELSIPMKYQFYSLRDSGIVHMLQSVVSPEQVMIQAGHADLQMTTVYARHAVNGAEPKLKVLNSGF